MRRLVCCDCGLDVSNTFKETGKKYGIFRLNGFTPRFCAKDYYIYLIVQYVIVLVFTIEGHFAR